MSCLCGLEIKPFLVVLAANMCSQSDGGLSFCLACLFLMKQTHNHTQKEIALSGLISFCYILHLNFTSCLTYIKDKIKEPTLKHAYSFKHV